MAYAIIRTGGKQFRVEAGARLRVPALDQETGETVEFEVLAVSGGDDGTRAGAQAVAGARVAGTVVEHGRGDKVIVFKKKRRKQYKRKQGHRQGYTTVKIDSIG
ncbi:MAG: 50S ribosomal protein L21 [Acidobacteria bacterium]|nr:MAG: 50S ribosomal protein L21 [Acidobacteriota bacterium]